MSTNSSLSSLSSKEYDEDMATEDNISESHITNSDEDQSDVKHKLKEAGKLKPKSDPDKDDDDAKAKI